MLGVALLSIDAGRAERRLSVYPLEQTIDARRRMAAGAATGKLVVRPRATTTQAGGAGTGTGPCTGTG